MDGELSISQGALFCLGLSCQLLPFLFPSLKAKLGKGAEEGAFLSQHPATVPTALAFRSGLPSIFLVRKLLWFTEHQVEWAAGENSLPTSWNPATGTARPPYKLRPQRAGCVC